MTENNKEHAAVSQADVPQVDVPQVDVPQVDVPQVDVPQVDVPQVDVPQVEVSHVDVHLVPVPLADLVETSAAVANVSGRIEKREAIASLLRRSGPDLAIVVGFLVGEPRQGRIGIGYSTVFGVDVEPAPQTSLTVQDVDRSIDDLAATTGAGSVARRSDMLSDMLGKADADGQAFLRKLFVGDLRQGALEGVMAEAIASASGTPAAAVRRAAMFSGDLGRVAEIAMRGGKKGLAEIGLEVMRPVMPMLAATAESAATAVGEIGRASIEWKLDGVRIQVHRLGDRIEVFTRNLNRVTDRVPEVVRAVEGIDATSVILDGEAMSLAGDGLARPFEETMSRFGSDAAADAVSLVPFFFDVLHLDGVDFVDTPLSERRKTLELLLPDHAVPAATTEDPQEAERIFDDAVSQGHEGVMVKDLSSLYAAGRRGKAWRKVKPVHTLDLMILAAEWGHGRRTGWLSNLHLGALESETGEYVMLGKTFKGLTDEMLAWQTERLLALEESRTKATVFVRPGLVVEIALDGLLPSPRYPGGMALRFARVKAHRPDKSADEVDTMETVRSLFRRESPTET